MGVGGGGLLVIYLTAIKDIPQLAAQGINLLFFLPSAFVSVLLQLKELKNNKKHPKSSDFGCFCNKISKIPPSNFSVS